MTQLREFERCYVFVDQRGDSSTEAVASLLEAGARRLRGLGVVTVHHMAFDVDDHVANSRSTLTIYYDRV